VEGTATNLLDDPAVGAIVCTTHDITKHKEQLACERAARIEAEDRANQFSRIFESMSDGVAVCDREGRITQVNAAFRSLFSLEADADPALLLPQEWARWAGLRDREGKPLKEDQWPLFRVLREDRLSGPQTMELLGYDRAGRDLFLSVSDAPLRDGTGQIVGGVAVYHSMAEQQQLTQQLQDAEHRLRSLVESDIAGMVVTDIEGRMYEVNNCLVEMFGYSREELLGGTLRMSELLFPEYRGVRARAWKTLIAHGASLPEEKVYRRKDGGRVPALVAATTINPERTRSLVVIMKMSDVKAAERHKQEALGVVSHELKTPLTAIRGFLDLALLCIERLPEAYPKGTDDLLGKLNDMLMLAQREAELETRLVAELVDMSHMEAPRFELSLQPCNLVTIVQQVVATQRQIAYPRRIELELPPQALVPVTADPDRIQQVLTNYLTNAFKYSPDDGTVWVRLDVEGLMAQVSVRDQGPGLTEDQQQHVWERFYQAESAARRGSDGGLGLGLYIARTIIAQHQGQVGIQSHPGQGATFWFALPLADEQSGA
jgi:PAS domain S-box-containing protein